MTMCMTPAVLQLSATLEKRGPAAAVVLTDDQVATLAAGKTPAVQVTIGSVTMPLRVGRMGGENLLGFSKATRAAFGVEAGDAVDVTIVADVAPRTVEVPADLAEALQAAGGTAAFAALAPSKRKEFVRRVEEARKPETRSKRIAEAVAAAG